MMWYRVFLIFLPRLVLRITNSAVPFFPPKSLSLLYTINVSLFRGEMYSDSFALWLQFSFLIFSLYLSLSILSSHSRDTNSNKFVCVFISMLTLIQRIYAHSLSLSFNLQSDEIVLNQFTLSLLLLIFFYIIIISINLENQINLERDRNGIFKGTTVWAVKRLEYIFLVSSLVIFWFKLCLFFVA